MDTRIRHRAGKWREPFMILFSSLLIAIATLLIYKWLDNSALILPTGACLMVLNLMRLKYASQMKEVVDFLIRWRWIVAVIVFALLVIFEIHNSSAAAYAAIYGDTPEVQSSVLFGAPHAFRADEYNVQLPYYFSQYYNGYEQISHQMSVSGQDMIMGYNAPVLALSLLGKPQTWGYLLFGNAKGLAWYTSFKTIMTFMAAFEMTLVLTRSRYMGLFGGFFILFAPAMQWWFSPHFFDVMMWSMILFDCGYYFFACKGWKKWGMTLLSICSLCGFTLAIFPALQVPCGVLMLCLMIACLIRDREDIEWTRTIWFNIAAVILGTGLLLGVSLWSMRDGIELTMHTVYPGERISVGGYGRVYQMFNNVAAPWAIYVNPELLNNSEFSQFNHFGIGCLLFYPILWYFLKKKNDPDRFVGDVFAIAIVIETIFMLFPIPAWLAKATLLSMCNRMQTVHGLTCALFTLWFVSVIWKTDIPHKKTLGAIVCVVYLFLSLYECDALMMPSYLARSHGKWYFLAASILLAFVFWLSFTRFRELFFASMTAWTVMTGCLVNPIMKGTACVTDYPIVQEAVKIAREDPDAWWLALDTQRTQNLLLANGIKMLDSTNFYPDYDKWKKIDPDLKYDAAYNRYANMTVTLNEGNKPTTFENPSADALQINLNPYDLLRLDVRYLTGHETDREKLEKMNIDFSELYQDEAPGEIFFEIHGMKDGKEIPSVQSAQ